MLVNISPMRKWPDIKGFGFFGSSESEVSGREIKILSTWQNR